MAAVSIDYVFRAEERIGDEVQRILGEMARQGKKLVRQAQRSPDESIHEGRLIIKRMRALLWFAQPALGAKAYTQTATQLRKAAILLAAQRDLIVMQTTLKKLAQRVEKTADLTALTQILHSMARESVDATSEKSLKQTFAKSMGIVYCSVEQISQIGEMRSEWPIPADRLKKAFLATHRAGKKARRTKDDTDYHEWRKKAKRLLYQLELTQARPAPKEVEIAELVKRLQETLGDHHDTVVATNYFRKAAHPSSAIKRVLRLLKKRRNHLREQAEKIASGL